jgi:hypothetical protein
MSQDSELNKEPSSASEIPLTERDSSSSRDPEATLTQTPSIPPEVLERLPEDERERVLELFSAGMQVSGPMANPLLNKLEPQHITDIIALSSRTIDATANDRRSSRLFGFLSLALLVAAALVVLLVFAIIGENDLLLEIVKLGGVGLGGFGGGYGFSAFRNRN